MTQIEQIKAMKQEEKDLLLKDLCARLPYSVNIAIQVDENELIRDWHKYNGKTITDWEINIQEESIGFDSDSIGIEWLPIVYVRPYLRPMSSMTEEEKKESGELYKKNTGMWDDLDWLNAHHFDYRGLIPMGLAIEAPEDMYKTE